MEMKGCCKRECIGVVRNKNAATLPVPRCYRYATGTRPGQLERWSDTREGDSRFNRLWRGGVQGFTVHQLSLVLLALWRVLSLILIAA